VLVSLCSCMEVFLAMPTSSTAWSEGADHKNMLLFICAHNFHGHVICWQHHTSFQAHVCADTRLLNDKDKAPQVADKAPQVAVRELFLLLFCLLFSSRPLPSVSFLLSLSSSDEDMKNSTRSRNRRTNVFSLHRFFVEKKNRLTRPVLKT
jgi:hypothetical protein